MTSKVTTRTKSTKIGQSVPINMLSDGVLRVLFEHVVQSPKKIITYGHDVSYYRIKNPLWEVKVSHVCARWRALATGMSNLWTSFAISRSTESDAPIQRFEKYLERSRSRPIDIHIRFSELYPSPELLAVAQRLIRMAFQHVERWRQVFITIVTTESFIGLEELRSLLKDRHAPHLECVAFSFSVNSEGTDPSRAPSWDTDWIMDKADSDRFQPAILRAGCPRLRYCSFNLSASLYLFPPISTLTSLDLDFSSPYDLKSPIPWSIFKTILEQSPLVALSVGDSVVEHPDGADSDSSTDYDDSAPIVMNHLQQLRWGCVSTLDWDATSVFPELISILKAPSLWRLSLYGLELPDRGSFVAPFPSLNRIEFIDCQPTGNAWLNRLAKASPSVTEAVVTATEADYEKRQDKILRWVATGRIEEMNDDSDDPSAKKIRCPWVHLHTLIHIPNDWYIISELYPKLVKNRARQLLRRDRTRFCLKVPQWPVDEFETEGRCDELESKIDLVVFDLEDEFPTAMWPEDHTRGYRQGPGMYYCESESFAMRGLSSLEARYHLDREVGGCTC